MPVLTIPQYIKIREVRTPLERLATELATVNIAEPDLHNLRTLHQRFVQGEQDMRWKEALAANQEFHFSIYRLSNNDVLIRLIENLWLLSGPFVNNQYPHVRRAHLDMHPHLMIIDALSRKAPSEAGDLVIQDLREGSYLILEKLKSKGMGGFCWPPKEVRTVAFENDFQSMIRKSGSRFSEKIMLKQKDEIMIPSNRVMI